jgi:hypothetical protein
MLGDGAHNVTYTPDTDRLRAGLMVAKKYGTFATFEEFLKSAAKARVAPDTAMEVLLNFTPESMSHVLYTGPVPMGRLPVCCWTDTTLPTVLLEHAQIGRRMCLVPLHSQVAWERKGIDAGLPQIEECRSRGPREFCEAADAILSGVMDEFFSGPAPVFREIAEGLGFRFMIDCDTAGEKATAIRAFFALLRKAPAPVTGRWVGDNWRAINLDRDSDPLTAAWRVVADGKPATASRIIDETDLQAVLGLRAPARLIRRAHGSAMVVRLEAATGPALYNEELYVELEPDGPGVHGPGNSERGEPPGGRFPCLPGSFLDTAP